MRSTPLFVQALAISALILVPLAASAAQRAEAAATPARTVVALPVTATDSASDSLLEHLLSRRSDDLLVVRHPDGTEVIDFADRQAMVVLIRRNDDGTISYACVDSFVRARQFMTPAHPTVAQSAAPEK